MKDGEPRVVLRKCLRDIIWSLVVISACTISILTILNGSYKTYNRASLVQYNTSNRVSTVNFVQNYHTEAKRIVP